MANSLDSGTAPKLIDLAGLAATVRRHLLPVLMAAAVGFAAVVAAYMMADKLYSSTGTVALDRRVLEAVPVQDPAAPVADSSSVDTEVQVLRSRPVIASAVNRLRLWTNRDFVDGFGKGNPLDAERAINIVSAGFVTSRQGSSYAITGSFTSSSPVLSANIVNAVIDSYVDGQVLTKTADRERAIRLLRIRLDQLRGEVLAADAAVAQYRAATNLVDINKDSTAAQAQMSGLSSMLAEARAQQAQAAATASGGGLGVVTSAALRDLRVKTAELEAQHAQIIQRYGPVHPDRVAMEGALASARAELNAEQARVRAAASADAVAASQRAASVQASINRAQGQLVAGNNASVRLDELLRVADSSRQIYQSFLDRYRSELATQGTERSKSYVIARAVPVYRPTKPDSVLYLVFAVGAALLAGAAMAMVLEMRERGFRSRAEIEEQLDLPVVASIPDVGSEVGGTGADSALDVANFVGQNSASVSAESFRAIRSALRVGQPGQEIKTVAITSAIAGEGKTSCAISLARTSALAGHRVLLIDCDVRRRASSRSLGAADSPAGLNDLLEGRKTLDAVMVQDSESGAYLIAQAVGSDTEYDLVASVAMQTLLADLARKFDLIVLDTAPSLVVAETRGVCAIADATLLAVQWRVTPVHAARAAVDQLTRAGAKLAGVLLTQVNLKAARKTDAEVGYYQTYAAVPA